MTFDVLLGLMLAKTLALSADGSPTTDDLVATVNDPSGTPALRKVTLANLLTLVPALLLESGAQSKISALTADTSPALTDILPFVKDPGGTPLSRKLTIDNLLGAMLAKVLALSAESAPLGSDIALMVDDPGGTPALKKVTLANLVALASQPELVRIQQIVTASSQATVDFTSIPGTYTSLVIKGQSRDTASGSSVSATRLKINNDGTAGNYVFPERLIAEANAANATAQAPSTNGAVIGFAPNDGNTAGRIAQVTIWINNYAGSSFWKWIEATSALGFGTTANLGTYTAEWASTAPITRATVTTDGTAFKDDLVWTLYGLK